VLVVLIILVLGLLTGWGAWYVAVGRYHQVPNLSGQAQSLATNELQGAGFTVSPTTVQEYSETAVAGTVIGTRPSAGAHLLGGKPVQLVLSRGPERFTVPQVVGKTLDQAQQAFAGLPLTVRSTNLADATGKIPIGQIIRTDPVAATKVKRNAVVTVYVSTGPPQVTVPDVTNQDQADAATALTAAGFKINSTSDYSDTVPLGEVVSQQPTGGTSQAKFSTVNLLISKGPETVAMPNIPSGSDPDEARATLQDLGLKVNVINHKSFLDFTSAKVDKTIPAAGTKVQIGSQVTLVVK
jgi:beta-lactam-binding protein with PASTA domain